MLPEASTKTPCGVLRLAEMAGPPSREYPAVPFPATVVIVPLVSMRRITWLPASAM